MGGKGNHREQEEVGLERTGVRGGTEDEAAGVRIVDCLDRWPGLEFHNVTEPSDQHTVTN